MPCSYRSRFARGPKKCQFNVPEKHLIEREGKWCEFHLPLEGIVGCESDKKTWTERRIEKFNAGIFSIVENAIRTQSTADFTGVIFPGEIEFPKTLPAIIFNETNFLKSARFTDVVFTGLANFLDANFSQPVFFTNSRFEKPASFTASSLNTASFELTTFDEITSFDLVNIKNLALFEGTVFRGTAFFRAAEFESLRFDGSEFQDEAIFESACAFYSGSFVGVKFRKLADFSYIAMGRDDPEAKGCNSFSLLDFSSAQFFDDVSFINRKFLNSVSFKDCTFHKAPKFHNCQMHQDTNFEAAKFFDMTASAVSSYRTLKLEMEKVRARREEAMFYAYEQKSLRANKNIGNLVRFFSWLYEVSSNYGQSLGRPITAITALVFLFGFLYASIASPVINLNQSIDWVLVSQALSFSLEQIVNPFNIWKASFIPAWFSGDLLTLKLLSTVESVFGLSFLALLLLSIRWRFKRG